MGTGGYASRIDRLSDLLPVPAAGPTLGEMLSEVTDPEVRAMFDRWLRILYTPVPSGTMPSGDQSQAAVWLYRAWLSGRLGRDPAMADIVLLATRTMSPPI